MRNVQQAREDVVDLLIKHGAKINSKDNEGNSILHVAADISIYSDDSFENGTRRARIIKTLLEHGADATVVDNSGSTVLHHLAKNIDVMPEEIFYNSYPGED
jgi:ankyrin repeat protein